MTDPFRGMDRDERNFHSAMYYTAGALWALGLAAPALHTLTKLIQQHQTAHEPTLVLPVVGAPLVRPYVR